jgi:hypothetical protein
MVGLPREIQLSAGNRRVGTRTRDGVIRCFGRFNMHLWALLPEQLARHLCRVCDNHANITFLHRHDKPNSFPHFDDLPAGMEWPVRQPALQDRSLKGGQVTPVDLTKFEPVAPSQRPSSYGIRLDAISSARGEMGLQTHRAASVSRDPCSVVFRATASDYFARTEVSRGNK